MRPRIDKLSDENVRRLIDALVAIDEPVDAPCWAHGHAVLVELYGRGFRTALVNDEVRTWLAADRARALETLRAMVRSELADGTGYTVEDTYELLSWAVRMGLKL